MTPHQQEIYDRSKAWAEAGWERDLLNRYQGEDYRIAARGYLIGFFARIRDAAVLEEQRCPKPLYSRRPA